MIYIRKKRTISSFFSCFTFFQGHHTRLVVGGQSWPYYIGSKRGKPQACPHSQCCTLFPEGGVVWKIPYSIYIKSLGDLYQEKEDNLFIFFLFHIFSRPSYSTCCRGSKLALLHRVKERKTPSLSAQPVLHPFP